jgi:hypothetical protein
LPDWVSNPSFLDNWDFSPPSPGIGSADGSYSRVDRNFFQIEKGLSVLTDVLKELQKSDKK